MKIFLLVVVLLLSGCSWFHRKPPLADPTQLIVTGAPAGSVLVLDGAPIGPPTEANNLTRVLRVAAGTHLLEVKVGDSVTFRENTYVDKGEKRVITVLSGFRSP